MTPSASRAEPDTQPLASQKPGLELGQTVAPQRVATPPAAEKVQMRGEAPKVASEPYFEYGERAAEGANEADGPFSAAC